MSQTKTPPVEELARVLKEATRIRDRLESSPHPWGGYSSLDHDRDQSRLSRLIDQARALTGTLSAGDCDRACDAAGIGLELGEALSIWEDELF